LKPELTPERTALGCNGFTLCCELMQSNLVYLKKLIRRKFSPANSQRLLAIDALRHFFHAFQWLRHARSSEFTELNHNLRHFISQTSALLSSSLEVV
jgi:hypothetical protein